MNKTFEEHMAHVVKFWADGPNQGFSDNFLNAVASLRSKGYTVSAGSWEDSYRRYCVFSVEHAGKGCYGHPCKTISG